jgi:hypothetical protein
MSEHTIKAFDTDLQELARKVAEIVGHAQGADHFAQIDRHRLALSPRPSLRNRAGARLSRISRPQCARRGRAPAIVLHGPLRGPRIVGPGSRCKAQGISRCLGTLYRPEAVANRAVRRSLALPPRHSITSSACASRVGGISTGVESDCRNSRARARLPPAAPMPAGSAGSEVSARSSSCRAPSRQDERVSRVLSRSNSIS